MLVDMARRNRVYVWADNVDIANEVSRWNLLCMLRNGILLVLQIRQVSFIPSTVISNSVQFNPRRCQTPNLMLYSQLSVCTLWQSNRPQWSWDIRLSLQQTEHTTGFCSQKLMLISVLLFNWLDSTCDISALLFNSLTLRLTSHHNVYSICERLLEMGMLWLFHIFCSDAPIAFSLFNLVWNSIVHSPSSVIRDPRYENVSTCSSCSFWMSMWHSNYNSILKVKAWLFKLFKL